MRLRVFFKSLLATPMVASKVIVAGEKPNRAMVRMLEMQTLYGTPVLVAILPDGKRLLFIHGQSRYDEAGRWDEYHGDWRDLDVVAWRHENFPFYKPIENQLRWNYERDRGMSA